MSEDEEPVCSGCYCCRGYGFYTRNEAQQWATNVTVANIAAWLRARMAEGPVTVEEVARALEEGTWQTK